MSQATAKILDAQVAFQPDIADRAPHRTPERAPLVETLQAIAEDARLRAETYTRDTVVPEGGE